MKHLLFELQVFITVWQIKDALLNSSFSTSGNAYNLIILFAFEEYMQYCRLPGFLPCKVLDLLSCQVVSVIVEAMNLTFDSIMFSHPQQASRHLAVPSDTNVPFTGCNVTARDGRPPSHLPVFFTGAVLWKGALRLARHTMVLLFGEWPKHISYNARPSLICPEGSKREVQAEKINLRSYSLTSIKQ